MLGIIPFWLVIVSKCRFLNSKARLLVPGRVLTKPCTSTSPPPWPSSAVMAMSPPVVPRPALVLPVACRTLVGLSSTLRLAFKTILPWSPTTALVA